MRELIADLFISLDGFASGKNEAAYFGYFGHDLGNWVREHLDEPQVILMGRVTYEDVGRVCDVGNGRGQRPNAGPP